VEKNDKRIIKRNQIENGVGSGDEGAKTLLKYENFNGMKP
jgi:hypothetical protein